MEKEDKLSQKAVLEIMQTQVKAYRKANKRVRSKILDNLESTLHRPRKSLIRSMNRLIKYNIDNNRLRNLTGKSVPIKLMRRRGRRRKYSAEVDAALCYIWESYNCICAERLHPEINEAMRIFIRDKQWPYSVKTTAALGAMPLGSMKKRLVKFSKERGLMRGFSTTRSAEILNAVPIFHGDWSTKPIGYGQLDTVVHSGEKLMGEMVYTVNFVDMKTYWTEQVAQLGKKASTTRNSIRQIEAQLPFPLLGLHPDSGDEFINYIMIDYCKRITKRRKQPIELTRSRPSKKNDNCNVEERNNSIVRRFIGYERYDCQEAVVVMNELYKFVRLYMNFFQPTHKLVSKYQKPNGQWVRNYDEPRSPFRRVLEQPEVPNEVKMRLLKQYNTLNPRQILARIEVLTIKLRKVQREQGYHFKRAND